MVRPPRQDRQLQVGVYLAYVGRANTAGDVPPDRPRRGPQGQAAARRGGRPERYVSAPARAGLEMLDERGPLPPQAPGSSGDDEMGRRSVVSPGIAVTERAEFAGRAVEHGGADPFASDPPYRDTAVGRDGPSARGSLVREGAWQTVRGPRGEKGPVSAGRVTPVQARAEAGVGRWRRSGGGPQRQARHVEGTSYLFPTRRGRRRWRSTRGCSRRSTGSGVLAAGQRGGRFWRTTKCAPGGVASPPGSGARGYCGS